MNVILTSPSGHAKLLKLDEESIDFEPSDRSVGIFSSCYVVGIKGSEGYVLIFDNGECQDENGVVLGRIKPIPNKDFDDWYANLGLQRPFYKLTFSKD